MPPDLNGGGGGRPSIQSEERSRFKASSLMNGNPVVIPPSMKSPGSFGMKAGNISKPSSMGHSGGSNSFFHMRNDSQKNQMQWQSN